MVVAVRRPPSYTPSFSTHILSDRDLVMEAIANAHAAAKYAVYCDGSGFEKGVGAAAVLYETGIKAELIVTARPPFERPPTNIRTQPTTSSTPSTRQPKLCIRSNTTSCTLPTHCKAMPVADASKYFYVSVESTEGTLRPTISVPRWPALAVPLARIVTVQILHRGGPRPQGE
ncbi:hypothetical protein E4T56_gene5188 [Termitomyces sp. T112]|nr:hypothetical protein E4T56_gene5188 [Termitomyces sp. T112]